MNKLFYILFIFNVIIKDTSSNHTYTIYRTVISVGTIRMGTVSFDNTSFRRTTSDLSTIRPLEEIKDGNTIRDEF